MGRQKAYRPRIAIVDDEGDFRALLRSWLGTRYDTMSFLDAEDLLESGDDSLPVDLVISDVVMPGVNGFKLCEILHADPRWKRVPILFLTGLDSDDGFLRGWHAGGAGYIAKPVERRELLRRVEELLADTGASA